MAINTTLAGLSTNPALNGPDGSTDLPSLYDNAIRYALAFTAELRDGTGFTAAAIPYSKIEYKAVQLGGGPSQGANQVRIGWGTSGSVLRVQVDSTDFGSTWPIGISGNAATATNATNATNATSANNANLLDGIDEPEFVRRNSVNQFRATWDGFNGWWYMSVDGSAQFAYTHWNVVQGRPTALSQFTNNIGAVTNASFTPNTASGTFTGGACSWTAFPLSDARVKKNVQPTAEDSLGQIARLDFKQFDFDLSIDPTQDGRHQPLGFIAQQAQTINQTWVKEVPTSEWLHLSTNEMLISALHAIQQLEARVSVLEGRK